MRIDAHQHFWTLERGDYGWLTPDLKALYKDFTPSDLTPLLKENNINGTVLVQAAPTLAETHFMLDLAKQNDFIKGVVGWVDFESPNVDKTIAVLAAEPKLVGLRPMIQDIADSSWMLEEQLNRAFESIIEQNLVFDALTLPIHLPNLQELLRRYPDLTVVIDHGSKPVIREQQFSLWAADMAAIALESKALVKLSGIVTEANTDWSTIELQPYVDHLLKSFGPSRIIWGSDWPVCTLASSYQDWCTATDELLSSLSSDERDAVLGGNAVRTYQLN